MKQKTLRHSSFKIYYRPDFMLGPGEKCTRQRQIISTFIKLRNIKEWDTE